MEPATPSKRECLLAFMRPYYSGPPCSFHLAGKATERCHRAGRAFWRQPSRLGDFLQCALRHGLAAQARKKICQQRFFFAPSGWQRREFFAPRVRCLEKMGRACLCASERKETQDPQTLFLRSQ